MKDKVGSNKTEEMIITRQEYDNLLTLNKQQALKIKTLKLRIKTLLKPPVRNAPPPNSLTGCLC